MNRYDTEAYNKKKYLSRKYLVRKGGYAFLSAGESRINFSTVPDPAYLFQCRSGSPLIRMKLADEPGSCTRNVDTDPEKNNKLSRSMRTGIRKT
jgi:hypothetical protein